jgi:hypothetical protein
MSREARIEAPIRIPELLVITIPFIRPGVSRLDLPIRKECVESRDIIIRSLARRLKCLRRIIRLSEFDISIPILQDFVAFGWDSMHNIISRRYVLNPVPGTSYNLTARVIDRAPIVPCRHPPSLAKLAEFVSSVKNSWTDLVPCSEGLCTISNGVQRSEHPDLLGVRPELRVG